MSKEFEREIKIMVWGDGAVGKSSTVLQFTSRKWKEDFYLDYEDTFRKSIIIDGKSYNLEIRDQDSIEHFQIIIDNYIKTNGIKHFYFYARVII